MADSGPSVPASGQAAPALQLQAGNLPQYVPGVGLSTAQKEQLAIFWREQMVEIQQVGTDPAEFKNHQLPLARIKKIMKSDEDVRMISAEAPVLFAKACEMFILELTHRSWAHSEENKRRTLQRNDIAAAITRTDIFDFLVDIVPREDRAAEEGPAKPAAVPDVSRGVPVGSFAMPSMPSSTPIAVQSQRQGLGQQQTGAAALYEPAMFPGGVPSYAPHWPPAIGQPQQLRSPGVVSLPVDARLSQQAQHAQQQSFSDAGALVPLNVQHHHLGRHAQHGGLQLGVGSMPIINSMPNPLQQHQPQ